MLAAWQPGTGLVSSPPVGSAPAGLWAELECAFLNTYQVRWQCFADSIGLGFAQGKTMLWRREFSTLAAACVRLLPRWRRMPRRPRSSTSGPAGPARGSAV